MVRARYFSTTATLRGHMPSGYLARQRLKCMAAKFRVSGHAFI